MSEACKKEEEPVKASELAAPPMPQELQDASVQKLQKLCLAKDLDATGSREELLKRLCWAQLTAEELRKQVAPHVDGTAETLDPSDIVDLLACLSLDPEPVKEVIAVKEVAPKPPAGPAVLQASAAQVEASLAKVQEPEQSAGQRAVYEVQRAVRALVLAEAEPVVVVKEEPREEELGVPSRILRAKNGDEKKSKPKKGSMTVVDLREECERLDLKPEGKKQLLVSRLAWAQLSDIELALVGRKHPGVLGEGLSRKTERGSVIEALVQAERAGTVPPPTCLGENRPPVKETEGMCRGALARAVDLHDSRRLYFIARAPTDRSHCQACHKTIHDKEWRIGSQVSCAGGFTKWFHAACFASSYGRTGVSYAREAEIVELVRELLTSNGRWSVFESQLPMSRPKASRKFAQALAKGKRVVRDQTLRPKKDLWDDENVRCDENVGFD